MAQILSAAILVVFLAALIADLNNAVYVMNENGYSVLVDKNIPDGSQGVDYVSRQNYR